MTKPCPFPADIPSMDDRRKAPRSAVMTRGEATWEDEAGTPCVASTTIEDRSGGGLSIRVGVPIRVGCKLKIKCLREQLSGEVINARPDKKEYILGIKLDVGNAL